MDSPSANSRFCHNIWCCSSLWLQYWRYKFTGQGAKHCFSIAMTSLIKIVVFFFIKQYIKEWCNETIFESYEVALSPEMLDLLWASVVSIFLIGGAVGSMSGAWLSNKLGRKKAFLTCSISYILGAFCFQLCRTFSSVELLITGRFLVGLAAGLTTSTIPMYCAEVAPTEFRGTLSVSCCLNC